MKKKIKKVATAAAVVPLAVALASLNSSPPPTPGAGGKQVVTAEKAKGPCVANLAACPFEGCGGDPELNKLKSRGDKPNDGDVQAWSLAEIISLNEESPTGWSPKNPRDDLKDLGEGMPVVVKGWLISAHMTKTPETCNCKLKGPANNDFHLNLVPHKNDPMDDSVVVEMSPRGRPDGWSREKVEALGDLEDHVYARVTGWLMFDSQHASFEHMPRATAWEVHPITKFEVCTNKKKPTCSDDTGWVLLENYQ